MTSSLPKKRYNLDHQVSNLKKSRLSDTRELIPAGKVIVERPFLFARNGDQKTDPIIIDFDADEELIGVPSRAVAPLKLPPTVPVSDDDAPQKSIDLTDSAQLNDEVPISSRVMNRDFDSDISLPACIIISELPSCVDMCDIKRLLRTSGFPSSSVSRIVLFQNSVVAVQFTDARIEDVAYSVLSQTAVPFPWKSRSRRLNIQHWPQNNIALPPSARGGLCSPVITNLGADPTSPPAIPFSPGAPSSSDSEPSVDHLYGSLRRDVYEDASDDESIGSPPRGLPMAQMMGDKPDTKSNRPSVTLGNYSSSSSDSGNDSLAATDNKIDHSVKLRPTPSKTRCYPTRHPSTLLQARIQPKSLPLDARRPCADYVSRPASASLVLNNILDSSSVAQKNVPNAPYNRPRRVLVPRSFCLPFVTISMRADAHFFDREKGYRLSSYSMPCQREYQHVQDACMVGDAVVVGYGDGPCQVSLINLVEGQVPRMTELKNPSPPTRSRRIDKKGVAFVSCLGPASSDEHTLRFFTGGYDKSVKLWSIRGEDGPQTKTIVPVTPTVPFALAFQDARLFCGAGKQLLMTDINHLVGQPTSALFSNVIHHIHVHPEAPRVSILELAHIDNQIQLFDDRKNHGFNRTADCEFGHRSADRKVSRYTRGSTYLSYFVRGYPDGCVCIWDYRNAGRPVMRAQAKWAESIIHTNFAGSKIACFGTNSLTFIDDSGKIL